MKEISKIKGFSLFCKDYNFIKEFAVKTEYPIDLIIDNARKEKIGLSSVQESNDMLLIARPDLIMQSVSYDSKGKAIPLNI